MVERDLGVSAPDLDTSRIDYLLDQDAAASVTVTLAGVGSGGAAVLQDLAMCGIRRWRLFDPDILEASNLSKHPAMRRDLGRPKVEIMAEWLADRNPGSQVLAYQEDVFGSANFESAVAESDMVVCAVDGRAARRYVNDRCVAAATPCSTGSVMRTGVGGEIYLYLPGITGCFSCMERYCDLNDRNIENLIPVTADEHAHRYGLSERDYAASGLAADISLVAGLHAGLTLAAAVGGCSEFLPPPGFNWLIFGIRQSPGLFEVPYTATRLSLKPRDDCPVSCSQSG
jgi:molybdopterin/thiamine biosynthesis adenylyltransferase